MEDVRRGLGRHGKRRSSDSLKVDKGNITRRQHGFRLAERVPFSLIEARLLSERMSALSWNDRGRRNGRRRCTARILDDAVLEKKLRGNWKILRNFIQTGREKRGVHNLHFKRYAFLPPLFQFLFCFVLFLSQNQSNNQGGGGVKKRRGGNRMVGKRTRCERAMRFFVWLRGNIYKYKYI